MRKLIVASAVATLFVAPATVLAQAAAPAAAPASPHTFTGNLTLATDYRFRGISQTFKQPTIQGGIDYSHSSGFYLGTWASNVTSNAGGAWSNPAFPNGNGMEWDFYGGYKFSPAEDWTIDLGALYYYYPGTWVANAAPYTGNSTMYNFELYGAVSYKWFTLKYSHAISPFFAVKNETQPTLNNCGMDPSGVAYIPTNAPDGCMDRNGSSKGSGYLDLSATYPLNEKWSLVGHVGHQSVKGYSKYNYTDWKIGVTYDLSGWILGAAYVDTNAKDAFYRVANGTPTGAFGPEKVKEAGSGTVVLSVSKTF